MLITVGKLGKMFGISRTTLLYYDSIGLLKPSSKSEAGYRLYTDSDIEILKRIRTFREVGVSLDEITTLLSADHFNISAQLLKRLNDLNNEIEAIKAQQDIIVKLLKNCKFYEYKKNSDRNDWMKLLETAGISKNKTMEWHYQFEKNSAEQHRNFLKMLKFSDMEIDILVKELKNIR